MTTDNQPTNVSALPMNLSGTLSEKDVKRLVRLTRGSTIGPTATYYAGVTAPVISAAMAIFSKSAFQGVGFSAWWTFFLSAILAALAGLVWYLIFMRWSYRHTYGRGMELNSPTDITLDRDAVTVTRGAISTRIDWSAIEDIPDRRGYIAVIAHGADAIIVPNRWFDGDKAARKAFLARLAARGDG